MFKLRALAPVILAATLFVALAMNPSVPLAVLPTERLANGDFEEGFGPDGVGLGWHKFDNGGQATYGWYDDTWTPVVWSGQHSQLIEINTSCRGASDPDRYAGIYQTVAVVPGATYEFSLHGLLRAREGDPVVVGDEDPFSYRVQWGYDPNGGTDWQAVTNWVELPWDTIYWRESPGPMFSYSTNLTATSDRLTLFLRVWKKWGTAQRELDVNLDAISLKGAMPTDLTSPVVNLAVSAYPVVNQETKVHAQASNDTGVKELRFYDGATLVGIISHEVGFLTMSWDFPWRPTTTGMHDLRVEAIDVAGRVSAASQTVNVGSDAEFILNGSFEGGFGADGVGLGWARFDNNGQASYGWYDDTWTPVVWDGLHSQLIEINTHCRAASEPDRYAGIYQVVTGLTPGATYTLRVHGLWRAIEGDPVLTGDEDPYSYRVQWGYNIGAEANWQLVTNWVELPWDQGYPRLNPEGIATYETRFVAPSDTITLFFRVWKKWPTAKRELDVNLDGISLRGYR